MPVVFPNTEAWDVLTECATFPANFNGQRIHCRISLEALQDNFNSKKDVPIDCFRVSRSRIECKAEAKIVRGQFEQDGTILIRSRDGA